MNEEHILGYNEIVCPYCREAQDYEPIEVELPKYGIEARCEKCEKSFLVDCEYEIQHWFYSKKIEE